MKKNLNLNLNRVPIELQMILMILKTEDTKKLIDTQSDKFNKINWELFLQQAFHHRIYPLLYIKLKNINNTIVPSYVKEVLLKEYKRNTFEMLYLSREMENLNSLFFKKNLRVLFLKGPSLSKDLYGDISLRTSNDLDILISIKDIYIVEKILIAEGFEKDDYIETVLNDWKWRHHHITFIHPQKRIKVEIHWRLNPGPGREPKFKELWSERRKCALTKSPIYILGREHLFLFLASHGARHGWSRIRWLFDIRKLLEQKVDWGKVSDLSRKYNYALVGSQSVILASELLYSKTPAEYAKFYNKKRTSEISQQAIFYFENMVNLHTNPVPNYVAKFHKKYLFSIMSFRQKSWFLISLLYPYPADEKTLPMPKNLHFLYFPIRPILCLWRKLKSVST